MKLPPQSLELAEAAIVRGAQYVSKLSHEAGQLLSRQSRLSEVVSEFRGLRLQGSNQVENSRTWTSQVDLRTQLENLVSTARASTVRVQGHTSGSGFVWNKDNDILTALHVVGDHNMVKVMPNAVASDKGVALNYRVHRAFEGLDTAWLKGADENPGLFTKAQMQPVRPILDTMSLPADAPVVIFGNPAAFGRQFTMSPGLWAKERGFSDDRSAFPVSGLFTMRGNVGGGNSGGAGFTLDGRVIGMVKASEKWSNDETGKALLVPFTEIKLRIYKSDPTAVRY